MEQRVGLACFPSLCFSEAEEGADLQESHSSDSSHS